VFCIVNNCKSRKNGRFLRDFWKKWKIFGRNGRKMKAPNDVHTPPAYALVFPSICPRFPIKLSLNSGKMVENDYFW